MYVCIVTAVDFSIQVQLNQWKILWLPVWMNLMLLLEVVLSLVRVVPVKLSQYLLDFSLSYGSYVKSLIMIVFVNLLMADVFSGIVGKFSEISLL